MYRTELLMKRVFHTAAVIRYYHPGVILEVSICTLFYYSAKI